MLPINFPALIHSTQGRNVPAPPIQPPPMPEEQLTPFLAVLAVLGATPEVLEHQAWEDVEAPDLVDFHHLEGAVALVTKVNALISTARAIVSLGHTKATAKQ